MSRVQIVRKIDKVVHDEATKLSSHSQRSNLRVFGFIYGRRYVRGHSKGFHWVRDEAEKYLIEKEATPAERLRLGIYDSGYPRGKIWLGAVQNHFDMAKLRPEEYFRIIDVSHE